MTSCQGLLGRDPYLSTEHKRPHRWYHLTCRCILYTLFTAFTLLCIAAFAAFLAVKCNSFFNRAKASVDVFAHGPHSYMYLDPEILFSDDLIVKPLVGRETTFDVVATVWMRNRAAGEMKQNANTLNNLQEEVIFSDTIFTGLTLKDKDVRTSVKLRMPTEIFKESILHTYDIRASFVLIPTLPSLLDNAVSYSSWRERTPLAAMAMRYPRMRLYGPENPPSLVDNIVDAYGIFTPLLDFHPIKSRCGSNASADAFPKFIGADVASEESVDKKNNGEKNSSASHNSPPKMSPLTSCLFRLRESPLWRCTRISLRELLTRSRYDESL